MSARDLAELRVPPHSVEAEQAVLGGLLLDNGAWDRAADVLSEGDLYRYEHRMIFGAIGGLISTSKPADVITVFERLQAQGKADECGGIAYLHALAQSVPSAASLRRYAEIVREQAMRRQAMAIGGELTAMAMQTEDVQAPLEQAASRIAQLQTSHTHQVPRALSEIAIQRTEHYEALEAGRTVAGWPTPFPYLNAVLNGGFRPGNLYVAAARPAVGKSSWAQAVGLFMAANGLRALVLSLEMSREELADRAVASLGRVSYGALQTGRLDREGWDRVSEALERMARLPLFVDDQGALTLREIRAKARAVPGLKLLVIDYLQLCASTRRDGNRNSEIEEISRGLKALAKELGIAVLVLSQLNRDVEKRLNKRPTLSDLRDSGAIEQDADVVMFLWPVREFEAEGRRIVGLGIDKNRQGRLGEVGLDFFGDFQRWGESIADIRPAASGGRLKEL